MVSIKTSGSKKAEFDLLFSVDPEASDNAGNNFAFPTAKKAAASFATAF